MDTDTEYLKKRIRECAVRAERTGRSQYLGFLNASEAALVREMAVRGEVRNVSLYGGVEDAERLMARFGEEDENEAWPVACVMIRPVNDKFAEDLSHRDFLGALMGLGVERDVMGDLRLEDNRCCCFCRDEMAEIILSLTEVRHTRVRCERVTDPGEIPPLKVKTERFPVASERIDAVVSEVCRVSRAAAAEMCRGEKVAVGGRVQPDPSRKLKPGDVFSVRGCGKFRYRGERGTSRRGKMILEIDRYL